MKLTVTHIAAVNQEIDVPERCPECDAPFGPEVGLSRLLTSQYVDADQSLAIDGEEEIWGLMAISESDVYHITQVRCDACESVLWESRELNLKLDEAPAGLKDLLRI